MKTLGTVSALVLVAAALLMADTWDTREPSFTKPHDIPAQDLLNMRGADRPTPLSNVNIEQKLNSRLPLDAVFNDEDGHDVRLGQYFDGRRPVILTLVYYECPM